MSTTFTRNLRHLMGARSWSTAELGRRIADHEELDTSGSIRKARRMAVGLQSPKLPDVETLAAIFQVEPADLAWTDFDELLKDTSPPADLGSSRGCDAPAGRDARGGTPSGGSHDQIPQAADANLIAAAPALLAALEAIVSENHRVHPAERAGAWWFELRAIARAAIAIAKPQGGE